MQKEDCPRHCPTALKPLNYIQAKQNEKLKNEKENRLKAP